MIEDEADFTIRLLFLILLPFPRDRFSFHSRKFPSGCKPIEALLRGALLTSTQIVDINAIFFC